MRSYLTVILVLSMFTGACAQAQRSGQSARITIGVVEGVQRVELDSASGGSALLGGAVGWGLARNQSSGRQAAALGGAALGSARANRRHNSAGMRYTIRTGDGSAVQIVTDQTEIRVGDCVIVEETGSNANIRRKDSAMCEPATTPQVIAAVEPDLQKAANRCNDAKEGLFAATTPEEVEVARQVMEILCND